MAARPQVLDLTRRLQRQQSYQSAPTLAQQWPGISEVALDLRFSGVTGQSKPMPYKQIFLPEMQVFFEFLCPDRDCNGGGFNLRTEVQRMVTAGSREQAWTESCRGQQKPTGAPLQPCPVKLDVRVNIGGTSPA